MSDIGGVWRTVGGRRIFIKDGEDLETAMKKSGKFKSSNKGLTKEGQKKVKELENDPEHNKSMNDFFDDLSKKEEFVNSYVKNANDLRDDYKAYLKTRFGNSDEDFVAVGHEGGKQSLRNDFEDFKEKNKSMIQKKSYEDYVNRTLNNDDYLRENNPNAYFYKMIEDTKNKKESYDPYKGTKYERKYGSVQEALDDPNGEFQKYLKAKEERKKKNKK